MRRQSTGVDASSQEEGRGRLDRSISLKRRLRVVMKSILILLHCESNTGYAIGPLEKVFFEMALALCDGDRSRIHFAYPSMRKGPSPTLPVDFRQYAVIDTANGDARHGEAAARYIR